MGGWIIMPGSCRSGFSPWPSDGGAARMRNGEHTNARSPGKQTATLATTPPTPTAHPLIERVEPLRVRPEERGPVEAQDHEPEEERTLLPRPEGGEGVE